MSQLLSTQTLLGEKKDAQKLKRMMYYTQLSQACSDKIKSPSKFDNKIVNCSHQTTIFH